MCTSTRFLKFNIVLGNKGAMIFSKHVAFSFAALAGIAISTLLSKRSSGSKDKIGLCRVKAECDAEITEGKDFINKLPDDVLVKILELLDSRDSVRTSILSKRWRNLYAFVPHMEFFCLEMFPFEPLDHLSYRKSRRLQERFINGVDTFLSLHSASTIFSCSLSCCFLTSFPNKLERWICSLGRLCISSLDLYFICTDNGHEMFTFHCGLISLVPSLVILQLTGCSLQPTLKIEPNYIEALDLDKVTLTPAAMACILSNCLNLERLLMENCPTLHSTLRICGSNLRLKYLFIKFCSNIEEIELWADNLIMFEYIGCKLIEFSFENVPKLETLSLTLSPRLNDKNLPSFSCDELTKALPPVSCFILQIYGQYHQMFTPAWFDGFRNVRELVLGFSMFKSDQLSVALVLEMCPLLYDFHLQTEKKSSPFKGQQVTRSFQFHKELKKVTFTGFSGTQSEMDAAVYILRSAMALKQMIISYCFSYYLGKGEWVKNGKVPMTEKRCKTIERVLGGHAISRNAKVTVRPIYVSDL